MLHIDIPHGSKPAEVRIGCAGWAIRREHSHRFAHVGTHLQRYATVFNCVEINSSFYGPHRHSTYERWADSVPDEFRFAVKLPKVITHELRLIGVASELEQFLGEIAGLAGKRGPVLVQLPPSFAFDSGTAQSFFTELRSRFDGDVVCEPRHETWFTRDVDSLLKAQRVARVAADPARVPVAGEPGGYDRLVYYRLHGSPRIYYSAYPNETLTEIGRMLEEKAAQGIVTWCIFDNTALGAATSDALAVREKILVDTR